ncbi:LANO_0D07822g1_1 [Lachancea nothofagi CBS 11611]|uniref:Transcription elongation factor n=1 Tax=Lachancea nothofagi CBS 11611 TaxID=1266666 RepID=A0A1G4JIH9_9SACH|nr:LANO_0D07822g1_1 [Lachancea nothofagi CBS 11611]
MDSKEVITLVKNLEKSKANNDSVLEILTVLDKNLKPTEKLLRETKVGVVVNQFKKSSNAQIASLVKKMIGGWRDAISKEKKQKAQSKSAAGTASAAAANPANGATSEARKHDKYVSSKPRSAKNDGVITSIYNHKLRDMVIRAFYDALAKDSEHPPQSVLTTAIAVEKELNKLNNCETNEKGYKDKYRVVYSNVISKNNPDLKHKITAGDVTPDHLVSCDPRELAPEHLKKKFEEISKQNLFNAQGATLERSVTDRFTCGKCKEKKVSYYQLQTRSADEPLTTFCTCEVCGNRWKFS